MALDIYSTYYMDAVMKEKPTVYSFIKDRYFNRSDVFVTEKVLVDYDDGEGNTMAPFVIPRVGDVPMQRDGYETKELAPSYIAPSRPLSIDDVVKRRAGESIFSAMTPEQRARQMLIDDLDYLDRAIARREEWIAVNTMLDNKCVMKHIGDDSSKGIDVTVQFYNGSNNPGKYTPTNKWAIGTETTRGTWYTEVAAVAAEMADAGRPVSDLVVGSSVAALILSDPWVQKMLDNRRILIGEINPKWQENGVTYIGTLNFDGIDLNIFAYRGSYQNRTSSGLTTVAYFPATAVLFAAPNTGKFRYGAVSQIENDGNLYTRSGKRVPKHVVDIEHNLKKTILTARPVAIPNMVGQWRACRDVIN